MQQGGDVGLHSHVAVSAGFALWKVLLHWAQDDPVLSSDKMKLGGDQHRRRVSWGGGALMDRQKESWDGGFS